MSPNRASDKFAESIEKVRGKKIELCLILVILCCTAISPSPTWAGESKEALSWEALLEKEKSSLPSKRNHSNTQSMTESNILPPEISPAKNLQAVDILDESLQFHRNAGLTRNSFHPLAEMPTANQNSASPRDSNVQGAPNGLNINIITNNAQAKPAPEPDLAKSLLGVDSRTLGAVGAAVLMGNFVQNGGIGGTLRSSGWNNRRHIRGATIGGY